MGKNSTIARFPVRFIYIERGDLPRVPVFFAITTITDNIIVVAFNTGDLTKNILLFFFPIECGQQFIGILT